MIQVMVDLETLSTKPNAVILSIGAVAFDDVGIRSDFKVNVDAASCQKAGLHIDADTVLWWFRRSPEARDRLVDPKPIPLDEALTRFTDWLASATTPVTLVWGNGANFDNVILRNAYAAAGRRCPWPYWADSCYRTVSALHPEVQEQRRQGTHHDALDDARHQAQHLVRILAARRPA